MSHVDKRTLVRGAIMAAGHDLTAMEIEVAIEFEGADIYRLLDAMQRDGEIISRKGTSKSKLWGFPMPGEKPYVLRRSKPKQPRVTNAAIKPPRPGMQRTEGRFLEERTATGKIVQVAPDWKPHREGRRYNVPGLLGYTSPLAGL